MGWPRLVILSLALLMQTVTTDHGRGSVLRQSSPSLQNTDSLVSTPTSSNSKTVNVPKDGAQSPDSTHVSIHLDAPDQKNGSHGDSWSAFWSAFWPSLFSWPTLILLMLMFLFFNNRAPSRIEDLFSPFRSVNLLGTEFVLSESGRSNAESQIKFFRRTVQRKFEAKKRSKLIAEKHKKIIDKYVARLTQHDPTLQIRSTIHVPDLLFSNSLYQLIDYYPDPKNEKGRGRVFSTRFGMIGRAWRLGKSKYNPKVPEGELVENWGMTEEEADRAGHGKESFACIILEVTDSKHKRGQKPIAILYIDSPTVGAFGENEGSNEWQHLKKEIETGIDATGLIKDLESLYKELIERSARIDIYTH